MVWGRCIAAAHRDHPMQLCMPRSHAPCGRPMQVDFAQPPLPRPGLAIHGRRARSPVRGPPRHQITITVTRRRPIWQRRVVSRRVSPNCIALDASTDHGPP
ncbi:hypothetical protein L226DRAFT_175840 [Lentinus tigrinus ALCF2SS1-7]|uniref:uncharacterized protein n=1 Tax=Lentinus tigrinus ALCF2SS1-7 TaxID=1328758 RepID=UPI001165DF97|nr:hypothetical protein L226DRAFT_175840 [Lentinus tigrinus ALCF2SS1-7]